MKLYHFTDKDLKKISIKYFGYNNYTKNDARYTTKRFFCYDSVQPKEYHLKASQYRYTIKVDNKNIYNLDKDKLKIKEKYNYNIDRILKYLSLNFTACSYDIGFSCYCVFKDIKPSEKARYTNKKYIKA